MRPLKLEVSGFTCFREAAAVSFDDLSLFAIEGPTGAGKSTLLDAMTYALYGQTPRLGGKGLDVLMSPGLSQMSVSLEFETAGKQAYRVLRLLEKKGSRVEPQLRLEKLVAGSWKQLPESERLKEAKDKLQSIVGLDYDGFTRAVILPQGAFDEFLRGDASKRRKLLINLLGLDRVEAMRSEAGRRAREAEAAHKGLEARLAEDYGGAKPERLRELKDELEALRASEEALGAQREATQGALRAAQELRDLSAELARVQRQLGALAAREPDYREDERALKEAQRAELIAPQLKTVAALGERVARQREAAAGRERALEGARERANAEAERLAGANAAAERIPAITGQLEALAALRPRLALLKSRGGRMDLARRAKAEVPYSDEAWDSLQTYKARLPAFAAAQRELGEATAHASLTERSAAEAEAGLAELGRRLADLTAQGREARERADAAEVAYEAALVADRAAALRPHLHVGESCPVCDQTVSVLPPPLGSDLGALKAQRDVARVQLEALRDDCRTAQAQLKSQESRLADLREGALRAQETLARRQAAADELGAGFARFKTADPARIEERLEEGRVHLLASLAADLLGEAQGLDPETAPAALGRERDALEEARRRAEAGYREAEAELGRLEAERRALEESLADTARELEGARAGLETALAKAGFASPEAAAGAVRSEAQQRALAAGLRAFEAEKGAAERRLVELEAKLAGRRFDEAAYGELEAQAKRLAAEHEAAQRRLGALSHEVEALGERIAKAKELRAEQKRHAAAFDLYRQLSLDLRGDNFPDYLLARVQGRLALRASQIVREVTDGRYDLRLRDNDFYVVDAWHTGEWRSAKTLSGGETFIASLALALALSDTIAGSSALGALFLDEGFGTLDSETLEAVARVLESLTRQGRLVGVITHVTSLSERLPARLRVAKGPEGSTLGWD